MKYQFLPSSRYNLIAKANETKTRAIEEPVKLIYSGH